MICEIAVATSTAPGQWWDESNETLATTLDILAKQAADMKRARG